MEKKKIFMAFAFVLLAGALILAGCTAQNVGFDQTGLQDTTVTSDPNSCASCTCLVCERSDTALSDGVLPSGFDASQLAGMGATTLAGGTCWLQACDINLQKEIRDSNGKAFQKSFMLGVAVDDYDAFKAAAEFCPMTDKWCFFGDAEAKDRWQNVYISYGIPAGDIPNALTVPVYKDLPGDPSGPRQSDVLCLFQGSKDNPYPPDATDANGAPANLFCASGSCSREFSYDSQCRRDTNGDGLDFKTDPASGQILDQVACECRQVSKYDEDHDSFFDGDGGLSYAGGLSQDMLAGQTLCHASYNFAGGVYTVGTSLRLQDYVNKASLPFYAQCNSNAKPVDADCIAYYDKVVNGESRRYCVEWKPTSAGECDANGNAQLDFTDLNQYGACGSCTPLMDTALVHDNSAWIDTMTSLLSNNELPVFDTRGSGDAGFIAGKIAQHKLTPAIVLVDSGSAASARSACGFDPSSPTATPHEYCLVAIPYSTSPADAVDNFDLFTISDADATNTADLIAKAKAARQGSYAGKAFIIVVQSAQKAAELAQEDSIKKLSAAGYVGIITNGALTLPPYDTTTFNTLGTNIDVTAGADAGSFDFFKACGEYYNGARNAIYTRQAPKQCGCVPCQGASCDDSALVCGGMDVGGQKLGLTCLDSNGNTVTQQNPANLQQCTPGCIAFPSAEGSPPTFNPDYVCGGAGATQAEDIAQGCYNICKQMYAGGVENDGGTRGYVVILPADIGTDTSGNIRYTPSTCYMKDSSGNFYMYKKADVNTPSSSQIVIFDTKGGDNACGVFDVNQILQNQNICAIADDLPAVVVK